MKKYQKWHSIQKNNLLDRRLVVRFVTQLISPIVPLTVPLIKKHLSPRILKIPEENVSKHCYFFLAKS